MQGKVKSLISALLSGVILATCLVITATATLDAPASSTDEAAVQAQTTTTAPSTTAGGAILSPSSSKYPYTTFQSWIRQLKATNADSVGWLLVPGTNINTIILQTPADQQNNVYYNERDWKKNHYPNMTDKTYRVTSTFLDYHTVVGENTWRSHSRNTVIYGHNWTNLRAPFDIGNVERHVMFAQLPSYKSVEFATANPYIYFSTEHNEGVWKVFAAAACEVDISFYYNNPNPTEEYLTYIIDEWKKRSDLNFNVDVNNTDRILTLSTCTREYAGVGAAQRYVVVARLLRPGETDSDPVTVSVNQNKKLPTF